MPRIDYEPEDFQEWIEECLQDIPFEEESAVPVNVAMEASGFYPRVEVISEVEVMDCLPNVPWRY